MALTASLDTSGILRVRLSGDWPTLQEQAAFRRRVRASGLLTTDTRVLADLRGVNAGGEPPWTELRTAMGMANAAEGPTKYALLTTQSLNPLAQMIEAMTPDGVEFRAFLEESAAVAWLLADWDSMPPSDSRPS
jgi:hypothetical protein